MRIKAETGLAVNILVALGEHEDGYTRSGLIRTIRVPVNQCTRVLQTLRENRLVDMTPVPNRKDQFLYTMAKAADEVTLEDIFRIYEGELINGVCLFCRKQCRQKEDAERCPFGEEMLSFALDVKKRMQRVSIQDLIRMGEGSFDELLATEKDKRDDVPEEARV